MDLFADPKIIGPVLVAIFASLIIPTVRDYVKTTRNRNNLLRMISEDISERIQMFDKFEISLLSGIEKASHDNTYLPVLFEANGLDGYVNWTDEKWLLPTNRAGKILKFYNDLESITSVINFTSSERFDALSRERKINLYLMLLEDVKSTRDVGASLKGLLASEQRRG